MEQPVLPIRFYIRNARLSLQKASFARRSHLIAEELQHLKNFEYIVSVTLPSHPLYPIKDSDKQILELEFYLAGAKKRLAELEGISQHSSDGPDVSQIDSQTPCSRSSTASPLKHFHVNEIHKWVETTEQRVLREVKRQQNSESRMQSPNGVNSIQEFPPVCDDVWYQGSQSMALSKPRIMDLTASQQSHSSLDAHLQKLNQSCLAALPDDSFEKVVSWHIDEAKDDSSFSSAANEFLNQNARPGALYKLNEDDGSIESTINGTVWSEKSAIHNQKESKANGYLESDSKAHIAIITNTLKAKEKLYTELDTRGVGDSNESQNDSSALHYDDNCGSQEESLTEGQSPSECSGNQISGSSRRQETKFSKELGKWVNQKPLSQPIKPGTSACLMDGCISADTSNKYQLLDNDTFAHSSLSHSSERESLDHPYNADASTGGSQSGREDMNSENNETVSSGSEIDEWFKKTADPRTLKRHGGNGHELTWPKEGISVGSTCETAINCKEHEQISYVDEHTNAFVMERGYIDLMDKTIDHVKDVHENKHVKPRKRMIPHKHAEGERACGKSKYNTRSSPGVLSKEPKKSSEVLSEFSPHFPYSLPSGTLPLSHYIKKLRSLNQHTKFSHEGQPGKSYCHTSESHNDQSCSIFTHPKSPTPGQTTFSNPVFDFDPPDSNQVYYDTNFTGQLHIDTHDEQRMDGCSDSAGQSYDYGACVLANSLQANLVRSWMPSSANKSSSVEVPLKANQEFNNILSGYGKNNPTQVLTVISGNTQEFDFAHDLRRKNKKNKVHLQQPCSQKTEEEKPLCMEAHRQVSIRNDDEYSTSQGECLQSSWKNADAYQTPSTAVERFTEELTLHRLETNLMTNDSIHTSNNQLGGGSQWLAKQVEEASDDMRVFKKELKDDILGFKNMIEAELDRWLESTMKKLDRKCAWANRKLKEHTSQVDSLKKHLDFWILKSQKVLENGTEYLTARHLQDLSNSFEEELDQYDALRSKDMMELKRELLGMLEALQVKQQTAKNNEKELIFRREEMIQKYISEVVAAFSEKQEKVITELKEDISYLTAEVEMLFKGKDEIQGLLDLVMRLAEEMKNNLDREENQNIILGNQKKVLQAVAQFDEFRRNMLSEFDHIQQAMNLLKKDDDLVRQEANALERRLSSEWKTLQTLIEKSTKDIACRLTELDALKKVKDEFEDEKVRWRSEREKERVLMMERVECLSKLYLGGLEEVQTNLMDVKRVHSSRLEKLEKLIEECGTRPVLDIEFRDSEQGCNLIGLDNKSAQSHTLVQNENGSVRVLFPPHNAGKTVTEELAMPNSEIKLSTNVETQEHLYVHPDKVLTVLSENALSDKSENVIPNRATLTLLKESTHNQDDHVEKELHICSSDIVKEREIVEEVMLEVMELATKAREMLDEIENARKRGAELTEQAMKESLDMKMKNFELHKQMETEMEIMKICAEQQKDLLNSFQRETAQLQEKGSADVAAVLAKAEGVVANVEQMRMSSEVEKRENNSGMPKAAQAVEELINIRIKTVQFQETAAAVAEALLKVENSLTAPGFMLLHGKLNETIRKLFQGAQESSEDVLESWKRALDDGALKARSVGDELTEVRGKVCRIASLGKDLTQDVESHIKNIQVRPVNQTTYESSKGLSAQCGQYNRTDLIQIQQDMMMRDLAHLNQKVEGVSSKLEMFINHNPYIWHENNEVPEEEKCSQSITALNNHVMEVESMQIATVQRVDEIQLKVKNVENSAAAWGPKYEAATKVLTEVEIRLGKLESLLWNKDSSADMKAGDVQHVDKSLCLYKEKQSMPSDVGRKPQDRESIVHTANIHDEEKRPETQMITLESRIEHVASAAYANLRILDAKVEHINVGVQTALEGAAMVESKCTTLGAELVKVVRALARSSRKVPHRVSYSTRAGADHSKASVVRRSDILRGKEGTPVSSISHKKKASLQNISANINVKQGQNSVDKTKGKECKIHSSTAKRDGLHDECTQVNNGSMDPARTEHDFNGQHEKAMHPCTAARRSDKLDTHCNNSKTKSDTSSSMPFPAKEKDPSVPEEPYDIPVTKERMWTSSRDFDAHTDYQRYGQEKLVLSPTYENVLERKYEHGHFTGYINSPSKDSRKTNIRVNSRQVQVNLRHQSHTMRGMHTIKQNDSVFSLLQR